MIGNDVVDLRDPETRAGSIHPRFDERVMAASERAWLASRPTPDRDRWMLWAAKEAAYKAMRRMDSTLVFSPSRFVVEVDDDGVGRVAVGEVMLEVVVHVSDDAIHAIAGGTRSSVAAFVRSAETDASGAVRRLAADAFGSSARIVMRGRIPELVLDRGAVPLSLAHHGDVVGFAALEGDVS